MDGFGAEQRQPGPGQQRALGQISGLLSGGNVI